MSTTECRATTVFLGPSGALNHHNYPPPLSNPPPPHPHPGLILLHTVINLTFLTVLQLGHVTGCGNIHIDQTIDFKSISSSQICRFWRRLQRLNTVEEDVVAKWSRIKTVALGSNPRILRWEEGFPTSNDISPNQLCIKSFCKRYV